MRFFFLARMKPRLRHWKLLYIQKSIIYNQALSFNENCSLNLRLGILLEKKQLFHLTAASLFFFSLCIIFDFIANHAFFCLQFLQLLT